MEVKYLYDTNIFLNYFAGKAKAQKLFSVSFLRENDVITSRIVRLELLCYPNLSEREELTIREMLDQFAMIPVTLEIEDVAIYFRRKYKLKIPDALIAASAYHASATVVTFDVKDFEAVSEIRVYKP